MGLREFCVKATNSSKYLISYKLCELVVHVIKHLETFFKYKEDCFKILSCDNVLSCFWQRKKQGLFISSSADLRYQCLCKQGNFEEEQSDQSVKCLSDCEASSILLLPAGYML